MQQRIRQAIQYINPPHCLLVANPGRVMIPSHSGQASVSHGKTYSPILPEY
jgi:hypothetical protein